MKVEGLSCEPASEQGRGTMKLPTTWTIHRPLESGEEAAKDGPKVASAGLGQLLRSRDREVQ